MISTEADSANRSASTTATSPNIAVLFDLDGTLLDTAKDFVGVLRVLCERHEVLPPSDTAIRNTVSDGARALVTLAFDVAEPDSYAEQLRHELLAIYEQHLGHYSELFDGMQDVLNHLNELAIPWGVVTNKPRRFAEPLMSHMNLYPKMGVLVCPDDVTHTKPAPEPMYKAAQSLAVAPDRCLYVGDHIRDIEAGKNASMTTVAAAYGYVESAAEAQAWQADHLIHSPIDLVPIISAHHQSHSNL